MFSQELCDMTAIKAEDSLTTLQSSGEATPM